MSPDRRDGQSRTPKYLKETKKIKRPKIEDAVNFRRLKSHADRNDLRHLKIKKTSAFSVYIKCSITETAAVEMRCKDL
jgi:hypothetical protein